MVAILCFLTLLQGASPYMLMDTTRLAVQGNYAIGYFNMTSHRRIRMFKFPALNTGLAKTLALNAVAETTCNLEFALYSLSSGTQIGSNFVGRFNKGLDVSKANWQITKDVYYYFTIQTVALDNDGAYCNMKLTCGQDNTMVYGIVTEKGPSPWISLSADGGYIHMQIEGQRVMTTFAVSNSVAFASASLTATATPSATVKAFDTPYTPGYTRFSPTVSPVTTRSIISSSSPINTSYFASNNQTSLDPIDASISGMLLPFVVGFILGEILLFPMFQEYLIP